MQTDDLWLLSPSVCHLQNMVDICVEEATKINKNVQCYVLDPGIIAPVLQCMYKVLQLNSWLVPSILVLCYVPPGILLLTYII